MRSIAKKFMLSNRCMKVVHKILRQNFLITLDAELRLRDHISIPLRSLRNVNNLSQCSPVSNYNITLICVGLFK